MEKNNMQKRIQKVYKSWSKDAKTRGDRKTTATAPIGNQLALYKKCLKKALGKRIKNSLVLVLGATPEVRNLALNLGCRVLAADINYDMLFNLESNIKDHGNMRNMVLRTNWLELDKYLKNNNFDAVIGDGVTGQLDPPGIVKLIENVKNLLKPGGYFITRIDVYLPEYPITPFAELLDEYRNKKLDFLTFGTKALLYSDYSKKLYNKKTGLMSTYKLWNIFNDLFKQGVISKKEDDFFQERKVSQTHYMLPKSLLYRKMLGKYFKEIPLKQINEVWPTYMGRVKKVYG